MKQHERLTIDRWTPADRPREKMMEKGSSALSDAELLAILIGSGNRHESAVELMRRLLDACGNNLNTLAKWPLQRFSHFKGMGPAKSLTIMAALEIGRRRNAQQAAACERILSSKDAYDLLAPHLSDLPHEECRLLLLNQAGRVIDHLRPFVGGLDKTAVDVRILLREALLRNATQLILAHNHPSGQTTPGEDDLQLTRRLKQACDALSLRLTDHLIIGDGRYHSFADSGML
ncbi:MAG: DNA repair protein RadC [Bacteroides sp.]|nr:DNA repair protein RadC [Bacteroides sp.]